MTKVRLEAFSDGVIAILITIMVLELHVPHEVTWDALGRWFPSSSRYVLSFVFVGIYWNNHHHMLHAADRINGKVLWANLHLLFWLSLIPFVTGWMGQNHYEPIPCAAYGIVMLFCGIGVLRAGSHAGRGAGRRLEAGARHGPGLQRKAVGGPLGLGDRARVRQSVARHRHYVWSPSYGWCPTTGLKSTSPRRPATRPFSSMWSAVFLTTPPSTSDSACDTMNARSIDRRGRSP